MWGDGTSDVITVTYSGAVGSGPMSVKSDPNISLTQRIKTIALKTNGVTRATLTVSQKARQRAYSVAYDNSYQ